MQNKIRKIQKRDGQLVNFDREKIAIAIFEALKATNGNGEATAENICDEVVIFLNKRFKNGLVPTVEEIQDIIEEVLIERRLVKPAKAYILYREQHRKIREIMMAENESASKVDEYLYKLDWQVKENANMAYSLQGLNNYISSHLVKRYWLEKIYPKEIRSAERKGDFHIHDLQTLGNYCCGWDLYDLLKRGFGGVNGKIQSAPPKHLKTALGHIVNFLYTVQGEIAGAVAFSNFDTLVAPFIRYDNLSYSQVKQAMQEFLFNMNIPTRVGFQTPFSNLTIDITPSPIFEKQPVIIGGEAQEQDYGDFQHEMDMLNKAFYEVMLEGDAQGRIFTFPIPTINITKDFPWNKPALEPMWKATAKYGINYFGNYINSDMDPKDTRSMCPLHGDEKILTRSTRGRGMEYSTIRCVVENKSKQEYEVYSAGQFIKGRFNKFPNQKILKVILENGHEIRMSEEHLNFVVENREAEIIELKGREMKKGMYLPYSLNVFTGMGGNGDMGYFVGAFAGDGSFDRETTVVFSLENERKKEVIEKLKRIAEQYFGANYSEKAHSKTKLYTLKIHSRAAVGLCRDFVTGKKRDKCYRARIYGTSLEFRKGVIRGHYDTDGGNRHRIYTSSTKMVASLNMLAATLGTTTSIYKDEREGRLGEAPNYAVLIYQLNRGNYGDFWFKRGDKLWVKIKKAEKVSKRSTAYCFEVDSGEPIFTIGTTGVLTHNCRLRLNKKELYNRGGGGLFGAGSLTGSIGVVTINMPRIGYLSKNEKEFFNRLEKQMHLAKESLEIKRKIVEGFTEKGLYPYCKYWLASIKKMRGSYWDNHFSTIGLIGMNEALLNFMGKDIGSTKGRKFALKIMDFMRKKLIEFQEETGNLYNLEATPAEGTSYRLALKDKSQYPDIITAGTDSTPYYTNSTQLPVNYTDDLFEALDKQDDLQSKYTGGSVQHLFLGERVDDPNQAKRLVKKVFEKFNLPYVSLSPTFSICPTHGYLSGEHFECPKCTIKQVCEVYSRIVGYYRPVKQWNEGKQQEFSERKEYKIE